MERLGLSSAEAASQLAGLAAATGVSARRDGGGRPVAGCAQRDQRCPIGQGRGEPGKAGKPGFGSPWAEAAAELAADGAELAGTLAGQGCPWARPRWCSGCSRRTARSRCSVRPACPAARPAAGGMSRRNWTARRNESPGVPLTCGGARAVRRRTASRSPVRRAVPGLSWRSASGTVSCSASWRPAGRSRSRPSRPRSASACRPWPQAARGWSALAWRTGTWPPCNREPAVYALLDGLADSVLVAQAIRDDAGQLTDFSIEHVSPGYRDPAGRDGSDLTGLTLLEAYPASVSGPGLFARARRVLADGVAQHIPGPLSASLATGLAVSDSGVGQAPLADLRVARFFDGAIFTWHREGLRRAGWPRSLIMRSASAGSAAGRRTSSPEPYAGPIRPSSCSAWRRTRGRRYRWPTCTAT